MSSYILSSEQLFFYMKNKIVTNDIFTPQGMLGNVAKKPNMDFLMNIFNIPRIYSVSGFGEWSVGQHSVATAFLALYWSKFNKYSPEKRDRLVTLSLMHDIHEAVTGDILPYFKTEEIKKTINLIQNSILKSFAIEEDKLLKEDLKLIDLVCFLYEISQSSPKGINPTKQHLLKNMYNRQKQTVFEYAKSVGIEKQKVKDFLREMKL